MFIDAFPLLFTRAYNQLSIGVPVNPEEMPAILLIEYCVVVNESFDKTGKGQVCPRLWCPLRDLLENFSSNRFDLN
jgi:hypothetical protein